eukprot:TRINITY_DN64635_c0_g1_i1.p1 TRINITY_DN64635_c0_g1~~TRINITY_DN64635_c0_g1_i1.p1  ORF type:complete len:441 (-),score=86.78 TRINITY_DN64635_c0_g1_i1:37-1323(-)
MERLELLFACFYVLELTLKIANHRLYFFCNREAHWNIFDFTLASFSVIEYVLVAVFGKADDNSDGSDETSGMSLGFLRIVRLLKIAKVLRVFRTLRFLTELRLMMDCCLGSFLSVFWALMMILFVLYVFALLIVQGLTAFMLGAETKDEQWLVSVHARFGTVGRTVLTLFQCTTAGVDWEEAYSALAPSGWVLPAVFLVFMCLFTISVWNIVTSIFVEKAMMLAQPDMEGKIFAQQLRDSRDCEALGAMFSRFADEDGKLDFSTIEEAAEDAKFRAELLVRGIDIMNVQVFCQMLSQVDREPGASGRVEAQKLASACIRMRGYASSIDLHSLQFESKQMDFRIVGALDRLADQLSELELNMKRINHGGAIGNSAAQNGAHNLYSAALSAKGEVQTSHKNLRSWRRPQHRETQIKTVAVQPSPDVRSQN